jgi:hypothetical protein
MSDYQIYDFIKDVNFHIKKKVPIDLEKKSNIFKKYLFSLKIFYLTDKINKKYPIFEENFFIFVLNHTVHVAKKIEGNDLKFDYIEILEGLKVIRKMKLKKLYQ